MYASESITGCILNVYCFHLSKKGRCVKKKDRKKMPDETIIFFKDVRISM